MDKDLSKAIEKARSTTMTAAQKEQQRQSFAYGNTKFENDRITRETVRRESERLKESAHGDSGQQAK